MKTRKVEFNLSFSIPRWWPYGYQWRALWKTLLYRLRPDHCHICGTRVDFRGSEFRGTSHQRRIMFSQFAKQPICNHCLAEKIDQYYAEAMLLVDQCDCCGQQKRVSCGIPDSNGIFNLNDYDHAANKAVAAKLNLDVRYGMQWWNGFKICDQCVSEALNSGRAVSSHFTMLGKKTYAVNHRGALIKT